jgi:hypothetical protein
MDDEESIPYIAGTGEGIMDVPGTPVASGARRDEDIALDLMKFVAVTSGYGKAVSTSGGVGFERTGGASKPEEYAANLLALYGKCLDAVSRKK